MRNLIRRILREENEKTPKSKLLKILNSYNGLKILFSGGVNIDDISSILDMSKEEIYQKFLPKIKPPYIQNIMELTKDNSIIDDWVKVKFGEDAVIYGSEIPNFYEIHDETIEHPGGTMLYWEHNDDWEEFEYKPEGIVLITNEDGTKEEQW